MDRRISITVTVVGGRVDRRLDITLTYMGLLTEKGDDDTDDGVDSGNPWLRIRGVSDSRWMDVDDDDCR